MRKENKTYQLQIRVSQREKARIINHARNANMGISEWVLSKTLPEVQNRFEELLNKLGDPSESKYILAEIHDLLNNASGDEFDLIVSEPPKSFLSDFYSNYVAAMVEYAAGTKKRKSPAWTGKIAPLEKPFFGSELKNLRLHLLTHSPSPFRCRNIFIDSTIGGRV